MCPCFSNCQLLCNWQNLNHLFMFSESAGPFGESLQVLLLYKAAKKRLVPKFWCKYFIDLCPSSSVKLNLYLDHWVEVAWDFNLFISSLVHLEINVFFIHNQMFNNSELFYMLHKKNHISMHLCTVYVKTLSVHHILK